MNPATGRYEQAGPCLVGECIGYVNLRAPDGGHLCPVPGQVPCAVYSSGVVRYVDAIIQMAARLGGVTPPARRVMTIPDPPQVTPLPAIDRAVGAAGGRTGPGPDDRAALHALR